MTLQRAIILGGAQLGLRYGITSGKFLRQAALYELLDKARYLGFHTIDLAAAYGCAHERVALWRRSRNDRCLCFGSKWGSKWSNQQGGPTNEYQRHLRLGRCWGTWSYLLSHSADLSQFEDLCALWPPAGSEQAYKESPKLGLSLYHPEELEALLARPELRFQALQIPYSLADRRFEAYLPRLAANSIELQLRSLYLQGLLLADNIRPYAERNPKLWALQPLLDGLIALSRRHALERQDILLYAGLRHREKWASLRLVVGVSCAAELLSLHYSLQRIASWPQEMRHEVEKGIDTLAPLAPLEPKVIVPSQWN
ncbi:MAG: hypothetical protein AAF975_04920 [Spirochaetota bacterium]